MSSFRVVYLDSIENPAASALFENQVARLLVEMTRIRPSLSITLMVHVPASAARRRAGRRRIADIADGLRIAGVALEVRWLPFTSRDFYLTPWRFPLFLAWGSAASFGTLVHASPDIIHCRSYPATALALALRRRLPGRPAVIFDTRGMYPEEGVILGRWGAASRGFQAWKSRERRFLRDADAVVNVSPTHTALFAPGVDAGKLHTIPTCVDVAAFVRAQTQRAGRRRDLGVGEEAVIAFVGSFSRWRTPEAVLRVFAAVRVIRQDVRLLVLTPGPVDEVRAAARGQGVAQDRVIVASVPAPEVAGWLAAADWGLIVEPPTAISPATLASKTGEYLASGLPLLVSEHCGGARAVAEEHDVGVTFSLVALEAGQPASLHRAVERLSGPDAPPAARCRRVAAEVFDVPVVAQRYLEVYDTVRTRTCRRAG